MIHTFHRIRVATLRVGSQQCGSLIIAGRERDAGQPHPRFTSRESLIGETPGSGEGTLESN